MLNTASLATDYRLIRLGDHSYLGLPIVEIETPLRRRHEEIPTTVFGQVAHVRRQIKELILIVIPPNPPSFSHRQWVRSSIKYAHDLGQLASLPRIVFHYQGLSQVIAEEQNALITEFELIERAHLVQIDRWDRLQTLSAGSYIVEDGVLWRVWRLHDDTQGSLMVAIAPNRQDDMDAMYSPLRLTSQRGQMLSVAVPLRSKPSPEQPLRGMRFVAKDMFDIRGITKTLCNKAYYDVSKPSTSTAPCVQKLVKAGAWLVGTTKLSSMLSREEPTEAIDYQSPFNPRGDGYQSPAGSSSGGASAVASYDWLDFAVSEDTSGSGRRPAAANGCFQYRPTHDLVDLEGMKITFKTFDTPVLHARSLDVIELVAPLWLHNQTDLAAAADWNITKSIVIYPRDYVPENDSFHRSQLEDFVTKLIDSTNSSLQQPSLADLWQEHPPPGAEGCSIQSYLANVIVNTYYKEFYDSQASFRDKYFQRHQKQPFVNEFVKWRWNLGRAVTKAEAEDGLKRLRVYKDWLCDRVMVQNDANVILVLPISEGSPNYRDQPPQAPSIQSGFDPLYLSPILGSPDIVLPIGQIAYSSQVTGRQEFLPLCVNIIGSLGSDLRLMEAA